MKELHLATESIFDLPNGPDEGICITTNGIWKRNGAAVMGAGIAKAACSRYPGIDVLLGQMLRTSGNHVYGFRQWMTRQGRPHVVFTFPTKYHWKNDSDIQLIRTSALELVQQCNQMDIRVCYLPRPGCSNGGLNWERNVRPVLEPLLDDRFIITTQARFDRV